MATAATGVKSHSFCFFVQTEDVFTEPCARNSIQEGDSFVSKTNRGGLTRRKVARKVVTISSNDETMPCKAIPKVFVSKCSAFYLRPLRYPVDNVWYADAPVGIHPLRSTISRLCKTAGFLGFYTNHSLRATTATRLYDKEVDEHLIAEKNGHKSVAIRKYKRTATELTATVDSIFQRKRSNTIATKSTATAANPSDTAPGTHDVTRKSDAEAKPITQTRDFTRKLGDGTTFSVKF